MLPRLSLVMIAFLLAFPVSGQAPARPMKDNLRLDQDGPLPKHAVLRIGTTRLRSSLKPQALAFTPDSGRLVSIDQGTGIHVWDVAAGKELLAFGRPDVNGAFGVSADGSLAAVVESPDICRIYATETGKVIRAVEAPWSETRKLCFSPDKKLLAAADKDMVVSVWNLATGALLKRWEDSDARNWQGPQLAFSPDGKTLAVDSWASPIHLWDVDSGQRVEITNKNPGFGGLSFSPDSKIVAAIDVYGRGLTLWDVATGKALRSLATDHVNCWCVCFAPDGNSVATGNYAGKICIWDVATGKLQRTIADHPGEVEAITYSSDGKLLATSSGGCTVRILDLKTGHERRAFAGPHATPTQARWTSDGKAIMSVSSPWYHDKTADGSTLRFWDPITGLAQRQVDWHPDEVPASCASADGKIFASTDNNGKVHVSSLTTGKDGPPLVQPDWPAQALHISADGRYLAAVTQEVQHRGVAVAPPSQHAAFHVWDLADGKMVLSVTGNAQETFSCRFLDTSRYLAVNSQTYNSINDLLLGGNALNALPVKSFALWDIHLGRKVLRGSANAGENPGTFSPSGRCVASREDTNSSRMFIRELATGKPLLRLDSAGESHRCAAYSPDGRTFAVGTREGTIQVWEILTAKRVALLDGHRGSIMSLSFSPDGKRLLSAGHDTTLIVWDVARWTQHMPRQEPAIAADDAAKLWNTLADGDPAKAYPALAKFLDSPKQALAILRKQLRPAGIENSIQLGKWITDLDHNRYADRELAMANLQKLGIMAMPALERAMAANPPLEVRQRVELLLARLENQPFPAAWLQSLRALEVLEMLGTNDAVEFLQTLARGDPDAWLTQEAAASLVRVRKRTTP